MSNRNFIIFLLCIIVAVIQAVWHPEYFIFLKSYIPMLLGFVMFSIGLTLTSAEFKQVYGYKWQIVPIIAVKYMLLPPLAWCLVKIFKLPNEDLIGLLLVSSAPGGASAAIMSFLARANVALTVVLTFITTLLAPLIMPGIIYIFLHRYIHIPIYEMALSIFWIVLFPLCDGLILRRLLGEARINKIQNIIPLVSMLAVILIVSCVVALNHQRISSFPLRVISVVLINNIGGILIGYLVARKLFRFMPSNAQAVGFEFGLQDSGLAVTLAIKFFGVATALCGALYSIIQNLSGPIIVKIFQIFKTNR